MHSGHVAPIEVRLALMRVEKLPSLPSGKQGGGTTGRWLEREESSQHLTNHHGAEKAGLLRGWKAVCLSVPLATRGLSLMSRGGDPTLPLLLLLLLYPIAPSSESVAGGGGGEAIRRLLLGRCDAAPPTG